MILSLLLLCSRSILKYAARNTERKRAHSQPYGIQKYKDVLKDNSWPEIEDSPGTVSAMHRRCQIHKFMLTKL